MSENVQINTLRWFSKEFLCADKAITIETSVHGWSNDNGDVFAFKP